MQIPILHLPATRVQLSNQALLPIAQSQVPA
jgi:hypothetical protein